MKIRLLVFHFSSTHVAFWCFLILFFHAVCKVSNFNMWTAKHLAQASWTELTLGKISIKIAPLEIILSFALCKIRVNKFCMQRYVGPWQLKDFLHNTNRPWCTVSNLFKYYPKIFIKIFPFSIWFNVEIIATFLENSKCRVSIWIKEEKIISTIIFVKGLIVLWKIVYTWFPFHCVSFQLTSQQTSKLILRILIYLWTFKTQ